MLGFHGRGGEKTPVPLGASLANGGTRIFLRTCHPLRVEKMSVTVDLPKKARSNEHPLLYRAACPTYESGRCVGVVGAGATHIDLPELPVAYDPAAHGTPHLHVRTLKKQEQASLPDVANLKTDDGWETIAIDGWAGGRGRGENTAQQQK